MQVSVKYNVLRLNTSDFSSVSNCLQLELLRLYASMNALSTAICRKSSLRSDSIDVVAART